MFFKKLENGIPNGYLITEENLRHVLFEVDFDKNPPPKFFESLGYAVVVPSIIRSLTPYEFATEYETQNEDGTWQQNWQITEISVSEKKVIFEQKLNEVKLEQNRLLSIYETQLKDPSETAEELIIIQKWINATNAMDLSDPFNVVWPTEEIIKNL